MRHRKALRVVEVEVEATREASSALRQELTKLREAIGDTRVDVDSFARLIEELAADGS